MQNIDTVKTPSGVASGVTGLATDTFPLQVSNRIAAVQTPVIPVVGEWARSTPGTVSLGQGVVYYGPPPEVQARIAEFAQDATNQKYGPVEGISPLVEALGAKLRSENRIESGGVAPENRLFVTAGGNMAFMNAVLAIADPGDEFILPTPYYFNHEMAITMANCRAVPAPTDAHYNLDPDAIFRAMTPRTRAVVTVSPNNPTGAVYPERVLRAVNHLCGERGIYHIHDEAYEYFTYGDARHFSPASISGAAPHTISLFSLSKSYGFASWRIGYMAIPAALFLPIKKIQDTILICPPTISQFAAIGCLDAGPGYCREKLAQIERNRQRLLDDLRAIADVCEVPSAQGAFYLLLRLRAGGNSMNVVERLIREHRVAVMPGAAFGAGDECLLRVAYGALEEHTAAEASGRLIAGLKAISVA